jgi:hypothetical protein
MTGELDVLQMVNALESDHLEQALELLHVSKASHREDDSDEIWPDRKAHLYALSSIMHSFAAFEGQSIVSRMVFFENLRIHILSPPRKERMSSGR